MVSWRFGIGAEAVSRLSFDRCVVRNTAARKGRTEVVAPGKTAARHLHYGRIILDALEGLVFDTRERETGLVCLKGAASVGVTAGAAGCDLNILIGKNVQASRIMAGVTFSSPGNWTSWPPHEHAAMLEEAYLYVMPAPAFGIQLVYTDAREPELAVVVREGDCVLMPEGYHPNVAAPGGQINFLWMMAARREEVDRKYGAVNIQPEFGAVPSGLDRGR